MPDTRLDHRRHPRWIICESSNRWSRAVKRFSPQILPPHGVPCAVASSASEAMSLLMIQGPKVILWEFRRDSLVKACECLIQTSRIAPISLQLLACAGISEREQLALSELPVAAFVRHPEDLLRLRPLLQGYFASHPQHLD